MSAFKSVNLPAFLVRFYQSLRQYDKDLLKAINENFLALEAMLNRGLNPAENFDMRLITFTSDATPDAENVVSHTLGKVPTDIIVTGLDKAAIVYNSGTAWTKTDLYLKVDTASVAVRAYIF